MRITIKTIALLLALALSVLAAGCGAQTAAPAQESDAAAASTTESTTEPTTEHQWQQADCTTPKTCTACGETEGEALGHTFGEWTQANENVLGGEEVRICSVCGQKETRTAPREKTPAAVVLSNSGLSMSCAEFAEYLIGYLPDTVFITDIQSDRFNIQGRVTINEGLISYLSPETIWIVGYVTEPSAHYKDRITVTAEDSGKIVGILPYLYDAIAPSLTGSARKSAENAIADAFNSGSGGMYLGKADLGNCMCTMSYIPSISEYPSLTFATKRFVNG